jgi:plastocyanin
MRTLSAIAIAIASLGALCLTAEPAQAHGRGFCRGHVHYQPAPVVYYPPPMYYAPRVHYAPPMYYQQPYTDQPSYAPGYSPMRPTTTVSIGASDDYFEPSKVNVQPGTTVKWMNKGTHKHTVTSNKGLWDSGDLAPGATYSVTFTTPGTYYYYCRHHKGMQGTIVVGSGGYGGAQPSGGYGGSRSSGY